MSKSSFFKAIFFSVLIGISACMDDEMQPPVLASGTDLTAISYTPQDYDLQIPAGFPQMEIPSDNPLTVDGVQLGHFLFFDPILSADSTMSCASCHLPEAGFTDNQAVSTGVAGIAGKRSSMSLLNIGFFNKGLFWDGRVATLEEQALLPIEDPIELHEDWPNVVSKFQNSPFYQEWFRKAFGIENSDEITKELAVKAIAQYERTLISANSKFDKIFYQNDPSVIIEDDEYNGYIMFFDDAYAGAFVEAECGHCHNMPLFTTNDYFNNGIDSVSTYEDFADVGLGAVTGAQLDIGKFRAPSLRNIEFTAPYMHDGRFETLEEVMDHYNSGGHNFINTDPLIKEIGLSEVQKQDIIAFLKMLSDTTYLSNPHFQNPF